MGRRVGSCAVGPTCQRHNCTCSYRAPEPRPAATVGVPEEKRIPGASRTEQFLSLKAQRHVSFQKRYGYWGRNSRCKRVLLDHQHCRGIRAR